MLKYQFDLLPNFSAAKGTLFYFIQKSITLADMIQIQRSLSEMLKVIEIAKIEEDSSFTYVPIEDKTNEFQNFFFLRYPAKTSFSFDEAIDNINEILESRGHLFSREIATALLVPFTVCKKEFRTPELINYFFDAIKLVKIKQYLIFTGAVADEIPSLNFSDFSIKELDPSKFEKFLDDHTKSDYFKKYQAELNNRLSIEVKSRPISVLDPDIWFSHLGVDFSKLSLDIQDSHNIYLSAVSNLQFDIFKKEFYEQQSFMTAYFGILYRLEDLEKIGCKFVNVFFGFNNHPKNGWIYSSYRNLTEIGLPSVKMVDLVNKFLSKNNQELTKQSPFSRYLKIISEFFANGENHTAHKNFDQAYIEYFVGLDFLLAPDTEKSKKLKGRIAFLVHGFFKLSLSDQIAKLDDLYDKRSNYVHNGEKLNFLDILELRNITKVVMAILFNLHKRNQNKSGNKYDEWIEKIDEHLTLFYSKGTTPNQKQWIELGVEKLEHVLTYQKILNF